MQTADKIIFSFKGIEIVQSSLNLKPAHKLDNKDEDFIFNIEVNQKIDASNKLVFVFVRILVLLPDMKEEVGSFTSLCVFNVENFHEISKPENEQESLPPHFMNTLSSVSISTTRGLMFTHFKGTYLHKAILPIIDPSLLKPQPQPL